jgi:hypothetical protein
VNSTSLVREWKDPCLANRWVLVANKEHPSWPRHLIRFDSQSGNLNRSLGQNQSNQSPRITSTSAELQGLEKTHLSRVTMVSPAASTTRIVIPWTNTIPRDAIRAGDRILVEQKSSVLDAHFEAIALQSAAIGESFRVRLARAASGHANTVDGVKASNGGWGQVVAVVAVARGTARWPAESTAESGAESVFSANSSPDSSFTHGESKP